jgi:ApbE superfamily uncharacterized protein (UPF0280 family)
MLPTVEHLMLARRRAVVANEGGAAIVAVFQVLVGVVPGMKYVTARLVSPKLPEQEPVALEFE